MSIYIMVIEVYGAGARPKMRSGYNCISANWSDRRLLHPLPLSPMRYSIYLLYKYKPTNTDAEGGGSCWHWACRSLWSAWGRARYSVYLSC